MGYEQRELSGSLFKNDKRDSDNSPNATGTALIGGVLYRVSAEARWKSGDLPDLETWREYFERAAKAKFIRGEVPPSIGHQQFQVSLDYLIREDSYAKALENTGAFKW